MKFVSEAKMFECSYCSETSKGAVEIQSGCAVRLRNCKPLNSSWRALQDGWWCPSCINEFKEWAQIKKEAGSRTQMIDRG